jgi:CDP-diacylglycerol--serine O-phosphatidyltransferase
MAHDPNRSPKHFSMIRGFHLADAFTLGNAACGAASVFWAMQFIASGESADFFWAAAFAPAAFVFDVFDGRVARWRQTSSALGRELDSLADVISFGVGPAALAFASAAAGTRWYWPISSAAASRAWRATTSPPRACRPVRRRCRTSRARRSRPAWC